MTDIASPLTETGIFKAADETLHAAKDGISDKLCAGTTCIRTNPLVSTLGALALGVVLGCLVSHRNKPTLRNRYLDEPLEELQSLARKLGERATRQAGCSGDATVSAMESIVTRIRKSLRL